MDIVLCRHNNQIFVELAKHYMLYLCEEETYEKLTADQIVLLACKTVEEHQKSSKPS